MNSMGDGQGTYCHELGRFVRVSQSCARVSKVALLVRVQDIPLTIVGMNNETEYSGV
jgi:hypothetical protein